MKRRSFDDLILSDHSKKSSVNLLNVVRRITRILAGVFAVNKQILLIPIFLRIKKIIRANPCLNGFIRAGVAKKIKQEFSLFPCLLYLIF